MIVWFSWVNNCTIRVFRVAAVPQTEMHPVDEYEKYDLVIIDQVLVEG